MRTIVHAKLIGIPFKWKGMDPAEGLDCFTFANYIRVAYGLSPYFLDNAPPGGVYPESCTMPRGFLLEAAKKFGTPVTTPKPFDVLVINLNNEDCLSTLIPGGDLAFMTHDGSRVRSLKKFRGGSVVGILQPTITSSSRCTTNPVRS